MPFSRFHTVSNNWMQHYGFSHSPRLFTLSKTVRPPPVTLSFPFVKKMHSKPDSDPKDSQKHEHDHDHEHKFGGILPHKHDHSHQPLTQEALKVTYWGIGCNIVLVLGKFFAGIVGHSAAMVADAAHSLTDLISDVVTLWAIRISNSPRDANHPYGHGKFDSIGSLAVSGLLAATAVGIASHSLGHVFGHEHLEMPHQIAFWAALVSIATKELLYRVTIAVGKKRHSSVLIANAWHHRSDAFSSVVALFGIGGALAGFEVLDPIAGVAVAGLILKTAIDLGITSVRELTDEVEVDVSKDVMRIAGQTSGVLAVNDVRTRKMGPSIFVDMKVVVDSHLSVSAAQQVVERVRQNVTQEIPRIGEIMVHVDVDNVDNVDNKELMRPQHEIESDVRSALTAVPEILGVSHFMAHFVNGKLTVVIDVIVDPHKSVTEVKTIAQKAKDIINNQVNDIHNVDVHLELGDHSQK